MCVSCIILQRYANPSLSVKCIITRSVQGIVFNEGFPKRSLRRYQMRRLLHDINAAHCQRYADIRSSVERIVAALVEHWEGSITASPSVRYRGVTCDVHCGIVIDDNV